VCLCCCQVKVMVRYIRREIRSLTDFDREAFFQVTGGEDDDDGDDDDDDDDMMIEDGDGEGNMTTISLLMTRRGSKDHEDDGRPLIAYDDDHGDDARPPQRCC
jgi:hypothetical protein